MNRETHIKLLLQHLDKLLLEAEKRTPGAWKIEHMSPARHDVVKESGGKITSIFRANDGCHEYREAALPDARFIASCAGNAEAGYRATRSIVSWMLYSNITDSMLLDSILESWPLDLLQT